MNKKHFSSRGAISIFLVIVLVPTITCSSLFVDASRVKSAQSLVSSAGDLTLNTVLSQYDVDLNEFYGLMASAQDTDDVLAAAEEYFTSCIKSQDINTTDTAKWVNSIKNMFLEDGDVSDLLGIELAPESKVSVTPTANGSLENPALIKTQTVEFMKYRSPINSVVALYEKFKSSSKELENTTKTSDLVDKKQEYYEAQGDVAKKAYSIYELIEEYDKLGITASDLQSMKSYVGSLESEYKNCHVKMVKDLYNTQGLSSSSIKYCLTIPKKYTHKKTYNNASAKTIGGLINKLMRAYDQFRVAKSSFDKNIKSWPSSGNRYYDIQYWAYCCNNSRYFTNLYNKEVNLRDSYINLIDAIDHAKEGALEEEYVSTYKSSYLTGVTKGTKKSIQSWWDLLKSSTNNAVLSVTKNNSKYYTSVNVIKNVSNLDERISIADTDSKLADMYNILNDYYTRYKKAFDLLSEIVNGLGKLKILVVEADNKFDTWENAANEYSSSISLAGSDKKEINEVKSKYSKLNVSDIQNYINHINNVKSALGTLKNSISSIKYNGKSIIGNKINGYSAFKKCSNVLASEIPLYVSDLNKYANTTFSFNKDDANLSSLNITDKNDPRIASQNYAVYKWMIEQGFMNAKDEETENKYNDMKKAADDQAEDANASVLTDVASKNDISTLKGLPSGSSADLDAGKITTKIKEVATFVSDMFSDFGSTVSQTGVNMRDDLFTVDYITSMLTWQTYEYEAKYNMLNKSQQKNITVANAASYYAGKNDAWKSTDVTQKYNKTLTNKMRNNEATNWSYCNEIEYIMYGKSIDDSKNALNSSIYMIRFALNIPVIFSTFYSDGSLKNFADMVNLATHGIVPAGLVKVVICLGLTALESAKDLKTLRCGIPVILIKKSKDDIFVDNWETFHAGDNPRSTDKTEAVTFFYSDYMKLFLFLKLLGSESYNIYGRMADVIQTNMSKCVLKNDDYSFSKSQVYYTIDAKVKVKPLMLDTSYVKSYMKNGAKRMDNWNTITYRTTRGY